MELRLVKEHPVDQCLKELHAMESRLEIFAFPKLARAISVYRTTLHALDQAEYLPHTSTKIFTDLAEKLDAARAEVITQFAKGYKKV